VDLSRLLVMTVHMAATAIAVRSIMSIVVILYS
jgi:hypothetical protein